MPSAQPLTDILSRVAGADFSPGNDVRLLRNGAENYPAWLNAIRGAARRVDLENYIFSEDKIGHQFAAALKEAAQRGVAVRVLYDWLGCRLRASGRFWADLRRGGVEVRAYNPPNPVHPAGWVGRDHRKLLCVDGEVGFTGGLCIGDAWIGGPHREAWRDTAVEIRGPAVARLEKAFAVNWAVAGGQPLDRNDAAPVSIIEPVSKIESAPITHTETPAGLPVLVVARRPENMGVYGLEPFIASIASQRLWIADAYFVATTGYVNILSNAARHGVDVRLLVPGASDKPLIRWLSRAIYRPLLQAGVRVYEWNGPMMHAKTMVADGMWSKVGSSNSNLASWGSNCELDIIVRDPHFASDMETMYRADLDRSTEIILTRRRVRRHDDNVNESAQSARRGRLVAGALGAGSSVGAALARRRPLEPSEHPVLWWAGLVALALAVLAVVWPRPMAWLLAALALWMAIVLFSLAWKLRHEQRPDPDH